MGDILGGYFARFAFSIDMLGRCPDGDVQLQTAGVPRPGLLSCSYHVE